MAKKAKTKTVGYIRVSTDKQAEEGVSLDAQREKLDAYAGLYDIELVAVLADDRGASAKTLDRPALQKALGMLETGEADAILVSKLDRLTRSVADIGRLVETYFQDGRWSLLSVSEQIDTRTAGGRLVLNVLASVSQWEREAIGERTSTAMRFKQRRGEYIGGHVPIGHRLDAGQLVAHEAERATVAKARELRSTGLSLRKVAAQLAEHGHVSRDGSTFHPMAVARMTA